MKSNHNSCSSFHRTGNVLHSGLKGKALDVSMDDIPSMSKIQTIVPSRFFYPKTLTSLAYLFQSLIIQVIVVWIGFNIPLKIELLPFWILYVCISGTTAMGFWVIAHECGHGAFSTNRKLETFVGYLLHSTLLVPYFSWQRSHAVHHRFTNHVTEGETHVPLVIGGDGRTELSGAEKDLEISKNLGKIKYGAMQLILHLLLGWPAYLLAGKTGGPKYGTTNHFWPKAPFSNKLWPSIWAKKVWLSNIGIILTLLSLILLISKYGFAQLMGLYIGPLIVVNIWLVLYTWLHHTDTDVPHLSGSDFSYMRGAFLSIDRPYGKVLDFLHHSIGSTHVIHHIAPNIPHYYAKEATLLIKKAFPKIYLFNPTPIHKALWHIAANCIAVKREKGSSRYIWQDKLDLNIDSELKSKI